MMELSVQGGRPGDWRNPPSPSLLPQPPPRLVAIPLLLARRGNLPRKRSAVAALRDPSQLPLPRLPGNGNSPAAPLWRRYRIFLSLFWTWVREPEICIFSAFQVLNANLPYCITFWGAVIKIGIHLQNQLESIAHSSVSDQDPHKICRLDPYFPRFFRRQKQLVSYERF